MKKGTCKEFTIYWYNPSEAHTGLVSYTTYSLRRAIELFRQHYNEDYDILQVTC